MPTTYTIFQLGTVDDGAGGVVSIDPIDGNTLAENAAALVGLTFGQQGSGLNTTTATMSAPSNLNSGVTGVYDQDNDPSEFFFVDGVRYTFDAVAEYDAIITYTDGTTATITAVIFQDTDGNIYWAPELTFNADQAAIEDKKILSLTLDGLVSADSDGLVIDRYASNPIPCFVEGTVIKTTDGLKPIEDLEVGDKLPTHNGGVETIRWIGCSTVKAEANLAPVRIMAGALGSQLPVRDLLVSRQHRMLVSSKVCQRMFDTPEVLVPAIKLTTLPGVFVDTDLQTVTYFHIKTDQHSIIYANGAPAETLLLGPFAKEGLGADAYFELKAVFPDIDNIIDEPACHLADGKRARKLLERHLSNNIPCQL